MTPQEFNAFANEDARNFINRVREHGNIDLVREALQAAANADPSVFLEETTLNEAIAAAEIVAALEGYEPLHYPEAAANTVAVLQDERGPNDASLARSAVENLQGRVELSNIWPDLAPDSRRAILADLFERLNAACEAGTL